MKLRDRLIDWLLRDDIKAISEKVANFEVQVPMRGESRAKGLIWGFLDSHNAYLRMDQELDLASRVIGNFQSGNIAAQNTIESLYFDTVGLMVDEQVTKWKEKLGLPVMSPVSEVRSRISDREEFLEEALQDERWESKNAAIAAKDAIERLFFDAGPMLSPELRAKWRDELGLPVAPLKSDSGDENAP